MKKNYDNPVVDVVEIKEIETSETNTSPITQPGFEDDTPWWDL